MFQLSSLTDYALRAMIYLASLPVGGVATMPKVAEAQQIPDSVMGRIMAHLTAGGLVQVFRGRRGGATLARPAASMTVLDVIEAMEGPLRLTICVRRDGKGAGECPLEGRCSMQGVWSQVQVDLVARLRKTTLATLAECGDVRPNGGGCVPDGPSAEALKHRYLASPPAAVSQQAMPLTL